MKKINSIWYGGKVILVGSILAFGIPLVIKIVPIKFRFLNIMARTSFIIGIIMLLVFSIVLFIELHQDKRMNEYYNSCRNTKNKIGEGKYECQSCGNRDVKESSKVCNICGAKFTK